MELLDLWRVLFRRRLLVAACFVAVLAIGAGTILTRKPVFESRAVLEVGQVHTFSWDRDNYEAVASPVALVGRLDEEYGRHALGDRGAYLASVHIADRIGSMAIEMKAVGPDPQSVHQFLSGILQKIVDQHKPRFDEFDIRRKAKFKFYEDQIAAIKAQQKDVESRMKALTAVNPTLAALLSFEKAKLMEVEMQVNQERSSREVLFNGTGIHPTRVALEPNLPQSPSKVADFKFLTLLFALAIATGVLAALIVESFERVQRRLGTTH